MNMRLVFNHLGRKAFLSLVIGAALFLFFLSPAPAAHALVPTGYLEFYIPGPEEQIINIFEDIDDAPSLVDGVPNPENYMHSVIAVTSMADNTTVYYDHWENGYNFDPNNPATADETNLAMSAGDVWQLESANIPTNPRGTATFYDGRDRIYVAGAAVVSRAIWTEELDTVFALTWEIYPTKPFLTSYIIPMGTDKFVAPWGYNTDGYDDMQKVYVLVQALDDSTNVTIYEPDGSTVILNQTLAAGESVWVGGDASSPTAIEVGASVTADHPVQVQFITGTGPHPGTRSDSRGYSAVPSDLWDNEYYNPVEGLPTTLAPLSGGYDYGATDLYVFNPNTFAIDVTWEDQLGTGTYSIPARDTVSYETMTGRGLPPEAPDTEPSPVPLGSGVYLHSDYNFWAVGSYDSESMLFDWGYSLVPGSFLTDEYFLGWAPGNSAEPGAPEGNGSPIYITPVYDQTEVFIDFSPVDGVADVTYTLDRLVSQKVYDPDDINTGMHIWASAPIAVVWGEDANSGLPNANLEPYMDLGYTTLPLPEVWVDEVLEISKQAEPAVLAQAPGQTATFTLEANTTNYPVEDVDVTDDLPPNWDYVPGTTTITVGTNTPITGAAADPIVTGTPATGLFLNWDLNLDLGPFTTVTVEFQAITTNPPPPLGFTQNCAHTIGTRQGGNQIFNPKACSFVPLITATALDLEKTTSTPIVQPGELGTFTIQLTNVGSAQATGAVFEDVLPPDFTYDSLISVTEVGAVRTGTTNPTLGDTILNWGTWTIDPGGTVTIVYNTRLDAGAPTPTDYENVVTSRYNEIPPYVTLRANAFVRSTPTPTPPTPSPSPGPSPAPSTPVPQPSAPTPVPGGVQSDPAISKAVSPPSVTIGDKITWTVTVWNPGSSPTYSVVVTDTVPDAVDITNVTSTKGTVTVNGQVVSVDVGVLQPGETVTITIEGIVNAKAQPPTVGNVAYIGSISDGVDANVYPDELPPTGGRPVEMVTLPVLALIVGLGALLAFQADSEKRRSLS